MKKVGLTLLSPAGRSMASQQVEAVRKLSRDAYDNEAGANADSRLEKALPRSHSDGPEDGTLPMPNYQPHYLIRLSVIPL